MAGPTAEMRVTETVVPGSSLLEVEALLESVGAGILVTGTAKTRWVSTCRRCLQPAQGEIEASFQEEYEPDPTEGETYPLVHDTVDLELVAREAILLDLPLAPLCREECAGLCPTCGADRNEGPCSCVPPARDPRWAGLEGLLLDGEQAEAGEQHPADEQFRAPQS